MKNSGQVTVFLCLIVSAMVLLVSSILEIISHRSVRQMSAMAVKYAVSDVKAQYNTYIFEHYHVLLFDARLRGKSEANLEEYIKQDIEERLGTKCSVDNIIVDYIRPYSAECEELKEQINDCMKYVLVSDRVSEFKSKFAEGDSFVDDTELDDIKQTEELNKPADAVGDKDNATPDNKDTSGSGDKKSSNDKKKDPRKFTKKVKRQGLLKFVMPESEEISDAEIDMENCISRQFAGAFFAEISANCDFDNCRELADDMSREAKWGNDIIDNASAVCYAASVFNCATEKDINDSSVLKYELEYLICGKSSDKRNLERTVERIVLVRMPINYSYLITDKSKMQRVKSIANALAEASRIPAAVYRVLIAGCWSYIEGIADVKVLLNNEKIPLKKTAESWITDIDNIGDSINLGKGSEKGTDYKDYIMLLMSMRMDIVYFRMLDIMDVNASVADPEFDIVDKATGLNVYCNVTYKNKEYEVSCKGGY